MLADWPSIWGCLEQGAPLYIPFRTIRSLQRLESRREEGPWWSPGWLRYSVRGIDNQLMGLFSVENLCAFIGEFSVDFSSIVVANSNIPLSRIVTGCFLLTSRRIQLPNHIGICRSLIVDVCLKF